MGFDAEFAQESGNYSSEVSRNSCLRAATTIITTYLSSWEKVVEENWVKIADIDSYSGLFTENGNSDRTARTSFLRRPRCRLVGALEGAAESKPHLPLKYITMQSPYIAIEERLPSLQR